MAELDPDRVRALCLERIAALQQRVPVEEDRVVCIVQANIARGRFQRFAVASSLCHPLGLTDYIDLVLFHICTEHSRITALEAGNPAAWQQLMELLTRRASLMIRRFRNNPGIQEARDFAHDACLIIFEKPYPFDVAFEAWACVILKNVILARYTRSSDVLDRGRVHRSLDSRRGSSDGTIMPLAELQADERWAAPFEDVEIETILRMAIDRLGSQAQREVTLDSYLNDLSDVEIARRMRKSVQAVYNLRNRALKRLREILVDSDLQENRAKKHKDKQRPIL